MYFKSTFPLFTARQTLPPRPIITSSSTEPAKPLRPTEMSYDELQRNPRFKSLSRRWVGIMVGIPVVIVSSYGLWQKYQKIMAEKRPGRVRGQVEAGDIGVDSRRESGVTSNGGV